jgi:hypothetical protein
MLTTYVNRKDLDVFKRNIAESFIECPKCKKLSHRFLYDEGETRHFCGFCNSWFRTVIND